MAEAKHTDFPRWSGDDFLEAVLRVMIGAEKSLVENRLVGAADLPEATEGLARSEIEKTIAEALVLMDDNRDERLRNNGHNPREVGGEALPDGVARLYE